MAPETSVTGYARELSYIVSAVVSILVSIVVIVLVLLILPPVAGGWFTAFMYFGELVGIDPLGFLLPIALVACFLLVPRRVTDTGRRTRVFRTRSLEMAIMLSALVSTLVFLFAQYQYGSVQLPGSWTVWIVVVGVSVGALYGIAGRQGPTLAEGLSYCYVTGALGLALSDIIRTLARFTVAREVVWGGNGLHDLVFWFGIYVALGYLIFRAVCPKFGALFSSALAQGQGPKGVG